MNQEEFNIVISRFAAIYLRKLKRNVIKDGRVSYIYLNKEVDLLHYDDLLKSIFSNPIYSRLFDNYYKGRNLVSVVNDITLYESMYEDLVDDEIIELDETDFPSGVDENGIPLFLHQKKEHKIIDFDKFEELKKETLSSFKQLLCWNTKNEILYEFLDNLHSKGPIARGKILNIQKSLKHNKKFLNKKFGLTHDSSNVKHSESNSKWNSSKNTGNQPRELTSNSYDDRLYNGVYRTFLLSGQKSDSTYIEKNKGAFNKFWTELKENGFISSSTKISQLESIFSSNPIKENNRIIWAKKPLKTLNEFVTILKRSGVIVPLKGVDHWLITRDCFLDLSGKKISPNKVGKKDGGKSKEYNNLTEIINQFCKDLKNSNRV